MGIGAYGFGLTSGRRGLLALLEGVCAGRTLCRRGLLGFWVWLGVPARALVLLVNGSQNEISCSTEKTLPAIAGGIWNFKMPAMALQVPCRQFCLAQPGCVGLSKWLGPERTVGCVNSSRMPKRLFAVAAGRNSCPQPIGNILEQHKPGAGGSLSRDGIVSCQKAFNLTNLPPMAFSCPCLDTR